MGQTSRAVAVYYGLQTGLGVPAVAGGTSYVLPYNEGASGLSLDTTKIRSNRNRRDGQSSRGRHGSRQVTGSYPTDMSLGPSAFEQPIQAVVRGTWDTAITVDNTTGGANLVPSITTEVNAIVGPSGSWLAQNLKRDEVIVLSGHSSAGNNNRDLHVTRVTATRVEVLETLTVNATPDTSYSILRPKKLINPAVPIRRLWTFEEANLEIDDSEEFLDCRFISAKFTMQPNGMVIVEYGVLGRNMVQDLGVASPYFTAPTDIDTIELTAADASIVLNGLPIALSSCDFTLDLGGTVDPVIGSNIGLDVSEGNMKPITGNITIQRQDFQQISDYLNEVQQKLQLHLVQPEAEPKGFIEVNLMNLTLDGSKKTIGQDGPMTVQIPFEAGKLTTPGADEDATMIKFQTSYV